MSAVLSLGEVSPLHMWPVSASQWVVIDSHFLLPGLCKFSTRTCCSSPAGTWFWVPASQKHWPQVAASSVARLV